MDPKQYKLEKELFVSGLKGGNMFELLTIVSLPPLLHLSHSIFIKTMINMFNNNKKVNEEKEYSKGLSPLYHFISHLILVEFFILLSYTYTDYIYLYYVFHIFLMAICFLFNNTIKKALFDQSVLFSDFALTLLNSSRKPFISSYRATMMISTVIAILAVDFNVFPRFLAKTENYGYSLMDIGVGSFIISHALVSPLTKSFSGETKINNNTFLATIFKMFKSVLPMLVLGSARFFMVKTVDYQEHVSEYGTHWNFFFTLGTVALFSCIVTPKPPIRSGLLSILIIIGYQILLGSGLENYMLTAERVDFISANKEGIFSSVGYCALYLMGIELGYYISSNKTYAQWKRCIFNLFSLAAVCLVSVVVLDSFGYAASRRLVNITYYLYILCINLIGIGSFLIATILSPYPTEGMLYGAVNKNQLFVFLIVSCLKFLFLNFSLISLLVLSIYQYILYIYLTDMPC